MFTNLNIYSRSATPAIALNDNVTKDFIRVDGTDNDYVLTAIIDAATRYIEDKLSKAIVATTYDWTVECLEQNFYLPKAPVTSVTSIKYYDAENVLQTLSSTAYRVILSDRQRTMIEFVSDGKPTTYKRKDAFVIRFVAGYSTVPEDIKTIIRTKLHQMFDDRVGLETDKYEYAIECLCASHKLMYYV